MSGTLECACGHKMVLERIEDAPWCCPSCGGGRVPEGMSRQAQRRAKAEFAKAKIRLGPKVRSDLDRLREQMDAMAVDSPAVPDPEPQDAA
jgi:PHP family Zn ribbon phosphoesterase